VALAVVLALVGAASEVEVALGDAVADAERLVFDRATADPVQRLYDLKREITEARRALLPMAAELPELTQAGDERRVVADRRTLERVASTVERIDRHLDAHDDLLSDMLQVHLSQVSVRQNEDMRKISAWAAILVYPTVVAGVYGMNFTHMPELHWLLGYPFALVLMVVGCVVLYRAFRRVGWL
jgi:magnesium transporter